MGWMNFVHQVRAEVRKRRWNPCLYHAFCQHYNKDFARKLCDVAFNPRHLPVIPVDVHISPSNVSFFRQEEAGEWWCFRTIWG